jgi:hypothetical protein
MKVTCTAENIKKYSDVHLINGENTRDRNTGQKLIVFLIFFGL